MRSTVRSFIVGFVWASGGRPLAVLERRRGDAKAPAWILAFLVVHARAPRLDVRRAVRAVARRVAPDFVSVDPVSVGSGGWFRVR